MALYKNRERGFGGAAPESDRGGPAKRIGVCVGGTCGPTESSAQTKEVM
jgi:hypothetical protein